jgi:hypothetical protein
VIERGKLNRPALSFWYISLMRLWLLLPTLSALCGCSGLTRVIREPSSPLELTTVFLYPVAVSGLEVGPERVFDLSQRACDQAVRLAGDRLAVFGPTDFKVIKPDLDNAWVATTALPVLVQSQSRADQGAALRLFVERRVSSSVLQAESLKGQARGGGASEETTWLVRAELSHPSSTTTLIEVSGQVTVDPFATPPPEAEWDPAPALTRLLEQVVAEALRHGARFAITRQPRPLPELVLVATPAASGWLQGAAPPAPEGDALTRELTLQNRARVLAPSATEAQAVGLAKALAGTFVLNGTDASALRTGDLILTVDGSPALPHTLARLRFKAGPAELEVKRATGATETIRWP